MGSKEWWFKQHMDHNDMVVSEVAATLKVSEASIRKLINKEGVRAPSKEFRQGKYWVYIYTPEDVNELKAILAKRITPRH